MDEYDLSKEISFKMQEELKDLLKNTKCLDVADEFYKERVIEYKSIVEDYEKTSFNYTVFYSKA